MEVSGFCIKALFFHLYFSPHPGGSQPPPWGCAGTGARRQLWAPLLSPLGWQWQRGSLGRGKGTSISRALFFPFQWRSLADPGDQSCHIPPLFIAGKALMWGISGKPSPTGWDGMEWDGAGLLVAVGCSAIHRRLLPGPCICVSVPGCSSRAQQKSSRVPDPSGPPGINGSLHPGGVCRGYPSPGKGLSWAAPGLGGEVVGWMPRLLLWLLWVSSSTLSPGRCPHYHSL